ncbi:hypothetical protein ACNI3K_09265 [Demequina sp. SO4-13]|uniref:hypothetical protein n=1 Tax=Demequina sp. SO4-13 TaxID=3401027 RepID=UPI003AF43D5E
MAQQGRGGRIAALAVLVAASGAAIVLGPGLWDRYGDEVFPSGQCTVTLGERTDTKTAEQANNIAIIVAGSIRHGLPARAATIGVATAIQESSLRNIDYGDRDSVGLFQQRPSQGWGSVEEILDPYYATDRFYGALRAISGWRELDVTVAAQAVQRSGFPDAYADHEEEGRLWASALTGHGGEVACDLGGAEATTARAFTDRVAADFGTAVSLQVGDVNAGSTVLTAPAASATMADAFRHWSVAVAAVEGVTAAVNDDQGWLRDDDVDLPSGTETRVAIRTD